MKTLIKNTIRPFYHYAKSKNQREFIRLFDKYISEKRYTPREVKFLKYKFDLADVRSFLFQYRDYFVDNNLNFETENKMPVIYDCGANVGTCCLYFKILYPNARIKAFEADPKIFEYLERNIKNNNLNNIQIYNKAVWIDEKGVQFSQEGADAGSIFGGSGESINIESIRLRDMIIEETKIDMLKIDIEGAEVEVLTDCDGSLDCVENIYIEYHSWKNRPQALHKMLRVLTENGFRYHFQSFQKRNQPFIDKGDTLDIDVLLIVFAWKEDIS
jgi:FkbM family methyltransferase